MPAPGSNKAAALNRPKCKVRTGCVTCKIRRVKCDEAKPSCRRCLDTGRKCDGYQKPEDVTGGGKRLVSSLVVPERQSRGRITCAFPHIDTRSLTGNLSGDELQWLQYFSEYAGPALSSLTDKEFWSRMLPQLSLQEPSIRYALMALSTSYCNVETAKKLHEIPDSVAFDSSVSYYNRAISNLHQKVQSSEPGDVAVPLACCLLFTCLELLYEDRVLMLKHLRSGLKILDSLEVRPGDGTFSLTVKQKLREIFSRLEAQATFYGRSTVSSRAVTLQQISTPSTKEPFANIAEAKIALDTLTSMELNFVAAIAFRTFSESCPGVTPLQFQRHLQERLINWELRLDKLQSTWSKPDVDDVRLATLLRVRCKAGFIYVSHALDGDERTWDYYHSDFAALLEMARSLTPDRSISRDPSPQPSTTSSSSSDASIVNDFSISSPFSLEVSLLPPLYLIGLKCRDPRLRREAIRLIENHPGREGLYDPQCHSHVVRRVMEIEEGDLPLEQLAILMATGICEQGHLPLQGCRIFVDSPNVNRDGSNIGRKLATVDFRVSVEGALKEKVWVSWAEDLWF